MGRHKAGKGRSARKARAGLNSEGIEEEYKAHPHTFIFNRGHVGKNINSLIMEMRRVMEPFTASHLKARKSNNLKDFVGIAGPLNVSHLLTFSKTEISNYMRVMLMPHGPTLTFKINSYTLSRDIVSSLKRHHMEAKQFTHHPMFIGNNLKGDDNLSKMLRETFSNLFPSMAVDKPQVLNETRRCVLFDYKEADNTIEFRHYNIRVVPAGLGRGVKKLLAANIPDMSKYTDISEFVNRDGNASESEAELDGDENTVILPQDVAGRGNIKSAKSGIRLTEIGPRMTLELVKIEQGLCGGEVTYHKHVVKTEDDTKSLQDMRARKRKLKDLRKQQQALNVKKKAIAKETNVQKTLEGMKAKSLSDEKKKGEDDVDVADDAEEDDDDAESLTGVPINSGAAGSGSEDDDIEYFRKAVGENPDKDVFLPKKQGLGVKRSFKRNDSEGGHAKKTKFDGQDRSRGASGDKRGGFGGSGRGDRRRDNSSGKTRDGSRINRKNSSAGSSKKNVYFNSRQKPKSGKKTASGKNFGGGKKKFRS